MRDAPYQREHERSSEARMERGKMPHTLDAAIRWLMRRVDEEMPVAIHSSELWRDRVSVGEMEHGVHAVGGSALGSLAWAALFRALLEGSPSACDEEGFYRFPLRSALSRLHRRQPFMARAIVSLVGHDGDWRSMAKHNGWPAEMLEVYLAEALRRCWMETYDQTVRRAA